MKILINKINKLIFRKQFMLCTSCIVLSIQVGMCMEIPEEQQPNRGGVPRQLPIEERVDQLVNQIQNGADRREQLAHQVQDNAAEQQALARRCQAQEEEIRRLREAINRPKPYTILNKHTVHGQWMPWENLEDLGGGPHRDKYRLVNFDLPDANNSPSMRAETLSYIKIPEGGLYDIEYKYNAVTNIKSFKKTQAHLFRKELGEVPQGMHLAYIDLLLHSDFGSLGSPAGSWTGWLNPNDQIGLGILKVDDVLYASDHFYLKIFKR